MAGRRYPVERDRDIRGPTELRIHGVGAASPEKILGSERAVLVAGDDTAGFYRLAADESGDASPAVEAYSWGGLTERGTGLHGLKRALWVLLLPYALLDTARRMVPAGRRAAARPGRLEATRHAVIDALAYLGTLGGIGGLFAITVDGVGLNCLLRTEPTSCARRLGLGWLGGMGWLAEYPTRSMVVALVPALIVLLGLGALARRTERSFADWAGVASPDAAGADPSVMGPRIGDPALWSSRRRTRALRHWHMAGALAFLAVALARAAESLDETGSAGLTVATAAGIVLVVGAGAGSLNVAHAASWDAGRWARRVALAVLGVAVAATLASSQPHDNLSDQLVFERFGSGDGGRPEGLDDALDVVLAGEPVPEDLAAAVGFFVAPADEQRATLDELADDPWVVLEGYLEGFLLTEPTAAEADDARPAFRLLDDHDVGVALETAARRTVGHRYMEEVSGHGAGWFFVELDAYGSEAVYDTLARGVALPVSLLLLALAGLMIPQPRNRKDRLAGFGPPVVVTVGLFVGSLALSSIGVWLTVYLDVALVRAFIESVAVTLFGMVLAALAMLLLVAVGVVAHLTRRSARLEKYGALYWDGRAPEARSGDVDFLKPLDVVRRTRWLAGWILAPLVIASVVSIANIVLALNGVRHPIGAALLENAIFDRAARLVALSYLPALAFVVWRSSRVGHLWDVLSFWPRWGHPFAPPGYAHRAIPELTTRLTERLTGPVVLSGHSQGSVIAAAVVAGLPDEDRRRVALLTYGSPLTRIYQPFFPAYFDQRQLVAIARSLTAGGATRWRNVYRPSDPIAGPIFAASAAEEAMFSWPTDRGPALGLVDIAAPDPFPPSANPPAGDPMPTMKGHSDYEHDEPYDMARRELWGMLTAAADATAP